MSSKTIDNLLEQITQIESLLQRLETQANEVKGARSNLNASSEILTVAAKSLESLVHQMSAAATTMQSLDMEATLARIDKLENRIDENLVTQKSDINKGLTSIAAELNERVEDLLKAMPEKVGSVINKTLASTQQSLAGGTDEIKKSVTGVSKILKEIKNESQVSKKELMAATTSLSSQFTAKNEEISQLIKAAGESVIVSNRKTIENSDDVITKVLEINDRAQKSTRRWLYLIVILAGISALTPLVDGFLKISGGSIPLIKNWLPN